MRRCWRGVFVACALVLAFDARAEDAAQSPEKLAQGLSSSDVAARRESAYQLQRLGTAARPVLPALIKALEDDDKQVWSYAVAAITALGPEAQDAIPALLASLDTSALRGRRQRDGRQIVLRSAYALSRIGAPAVAPLLDALKKEDPGLRIGAARGFSALGGLAKPAIPLLVNNLADGRDFVREETIAALGLLGAEVGPALVAALADADPKRRAGAALALGQISPPFRAAAAPLEQALSKESDAAARTAFLTALPSVGVEPARAVELLLASAIGEDAVQRHEALNALLAARPVRLQAVPKFAALLRDAKPAVRERAAFALGRCGPEAAPILPALLDAARANGGAPVFADALAEIGPAVLPLLIAELGKGKPEENAWILHSLRGFGAPAVPVLIDSLRHPSPAVRAAAANAVGAIGRDAHAAIDPLFSLAEDPIPEARAAALRALSMQRAEPAQLQPLLDLALQNPNAEVRRAGAAGTAALGGAARLGVPALLELLAGDDAAARLAAIEALGLLGPQAASAVEPLTARLADPALQSRILETLGKVGPAAAPALPRLLELLKETNQRAAVLPALAGIGRGAGLALPLIEASLNDSESQVRALAVTALAAVEPDDGKVLAKILPMVSEESGRVRRATCQALIKFGPRSRPAAPAIVRMLERENDRTLALEALRAIGVDTLPELKQMLTHRDLRVRTLACESLGTLGPAAKEAAPQLRELLAQEPLRGPASAALAKIEAPR